MVAVWRGESRPFSGQCGDAVGGEQRGRGAKALEQRPWKVGRSSRSINGSRQAFEIDAKRIHWSGIS